MRVQAAAADKIVSSRLPIQSKVVELAKTKVTSKSGPAGKKSGFTRLFMLGMLGMLLLSALFALGVGSPSVIY